MVSGPGRDDQTRRREERRQLLQWTGVEKERRFRHRGVRLRHRSGMDDRTRAKGKDSPDE